jgi:hypothetical protein
LGLSGPASAALSVTVADATAPLTGSVTILDNGVGDTNPLVGIIDFSGTVGSFTVSLEANTNQPGASTGFITNTTVDARNTSGGTQTLTVTTNSTGFTDPAGDPLSVATGVSATRTNAFGTGGNTTATVQSFLDGAAAGTAGPVTTSLVGVPVSAGDLESATRATATYDLQQVITITAGNNSSANVRGDTTAFAPTAVPAPASLLMALSGTPVLGGYFWLRRRVNLRRLAIA